ncbi:uncharacterized protein LOC113238470 isoform X2 [Hyposmocoma kahamanoa]|uniref:uncharacterized protein LOC113238470 isoform X2 n=1 Tax=Hyposmocoma kahamanoa TaxID=1477025 RepID=UPI000E6D6791|nr:uncharacterized protein LOC113238470 isoform X2 [Hyposmocoma kahamanoa]
MRPSMVSVGHVCALALHLRQPLDHPRPPPAQRHEIVDTNSSTASSWTLEQLGSEGPSASNDSGSEGVAEGADVARELAALALVRAQLPRAAAQLVKALPKPAPEIAQPLQQILQLAALLQCRNHALIDVETALEAAEGQNTDNIGRKQLVPVSMIGGKRTPTAKQKPKSIPKVKEVQLKVFNQVECDSASDLPNLDPLRLRTE